jgi:transposase InsO family protein
MRQNRLRGAYLRKGWKGGSTKQNPEHTAAPDLVNRDFSRPGPNQLWVADLTRIMTGGGVLWLASARDAFSNRVVGWATAARVDTNLVLRALEYGLWSREVRAGQLTHHSDKGCQYTAIRFTHRLADAGIAPSTGRVSGPPPEAPTALAGPRTGSGGRRPRPARVERPIVGPLPRLSFTNIFTRLMKLLSKTKDHHNNRDDHN